MKINSVEVGGTSYRNIILAHQKIVNNGFNQTLIC